MSEIPARDQDQAGATTPFAQEDLRRAAEVFTLVVSRLDDEERTHLGLELLDAARSGDDESLRGTLDSWFMSIVARQHPDFARQTKEYQNLRESGDLLKGVDFEGLASP